MFFSTGQSPERAVVPKKEEEMAAVSGKDGEKT
jgi:hypothetical protein